jgi:hypothetical protein
MDLKDVQITVEPYVGKLTGLATSNDIAEFMVEQGVRSPGERDVVRYRRLHFQ